MCHFFGISRAAYYKWTKRPKKLQNTLKRLFLHPPLNPKRAAAPLQKQQPEEKYKLKTEHEWHGSSGIYSFLIGVALPRHQ